LDGGAGGFDVKHKKDLKNVPNSFENNLTLRKNVPNISNHFRNQEALFQLGLSLHITVKEVDIGRY